MKRTLLYFGSFNPIHKGHISLAEYTIEHDLCDEVILIVSPRNPLKQVADLASEEARYEMVELACSESKYPEKILPSMIEFMLDRPSYTINTLRYLRENHGEGREFSILFGGDIIPQLHKWRDYEDILNEYNIYVYPRKGEVIDRYLDKIQIINDAPYFDFSSTQVRESLWYSRSVSYMLHPAVEEYIRTNNIWSPEQRLSSLDEQISREPSSNLYVERGGWHFHNSNFGEALNDFNRALSIEPTHNEATELRRMVEEILKFRHIDIYNP